MAAEAEKYPPSYEAGGREQTQARPSETCIVVSSDPEGIEKCRCRTNDGITTFSVLTPSGAWVQCIEGGIKSGDTFYRVTDPKDGEIFQVVLNCGPV